MTSIHSGVVVYYSSVSGNTMWNKNTDRVTFLLDAAKIAYTLIDVTTSADDLRYMKQHSKMTKDVGILPQVFKDGVFVGGRDEIDEANEYGEIKQLFGLESATTTPNQDPSLAAQADQSKATSSATGTSISNTNNATSSIQQAATGSLPLQHTK
jgi:glutaredoxin-related protein